MDFGAPRDGLVAVLALGAEPGLAMFYAFTFNDHVVRRHAPDRAPDCQVTDLGAVSARNGANRSLGPNVQRRRSDGGLLSLLA
jgi:hypothetical protein